MKKTLALTLAFLLLGSAGAATAECSHVYVQEGSAVKADCETDGSITMVCNLCGDKQTVIEEPALGHDLVLTSQTPATCTSTGKETYICSRCGEKQNVTLEKLPHTVDEYTVKKEATCEKDGKREGVCTVCGKKFTETIPAPGHAFTYDILVAATASGKGHRNGVCTVCGKTVTEDYYMEGTLLRGQEETDENLAATAEMQMALIGLGYLTGNADGDYGKKTEKAVSAFQTENGLEASGIAYPETRNAIKEQWYAKNGWQAPSAESHCTFDEDGMHLCARHLGWGEAELALRENLCGEIEIDSLLYEEIVYLWEEELLVRANAFAAVCDEADYEQSVFRFRMETALMQEAAVHGEGSAAWYERKIDLLREECETLCAETEEEAAS